MSDFIWVNSDDDLSLKVVEFKIDLLRDVVLLDQFYFFTCFSSQAFLYYTLRIDKTATHQVEWMVSRWRNASYLINYANIRGESSLHDLVQESESIDKYKFKTVVDADRIEQDWYDYSTTSNPFDAKTRWILQLKQNYIQKLIPEVGYNSRGLEKSWRLNSFYNLQSKFYQISPRIGLEFAELLTFEFEKLAKIELGDYTQAIRMVFLELKRISNHLKFLHTNLLLLNDPHCVLIKQLLESIHRLMMKINSQHGIDYSIMFGTLGVSIPTGWFNQCFELVRNIESFFIRMKDSFSSHIQNFKKLHTGFVNYDQILHGGFSGPNLRAAGINWDQRLNHKRYFYDDLGFNTAIGIKSSSFDRIMVRVQEIINSSLVIEQLTDNMPEIAKMDTHFTISKESSIWSLLSDAKVEQDQLLQFVGDGSQGEMHILLKLNLQDRMIQLERLTTPSFMNFSLISEIAVNQDFEEFKTCYASLGLCAWERDL
jgi:NADH:ubiquinone oxidoreductase subunit D